MSSSDSNSNSNYRQYNPYQDLEIPYKRLYDLPTSPEFLSQEAVAQCRSWGENLTYYTGIGYLAGTTGGASVGLYNGIKAGEATNTTKLRVNRILSSTGHERRKYGNRLGVIGLIYVGLESVLVALRDEDDWVNSVAAGLGTSEIFRAVNGIRFAAVAGALGGLAIGAMVGAK